MSNLSPERNKAMVLEAFETLFNKRDYAATELHSAQRAHTARSGRTVQSRQLGAGNFAL